MRIAITGASGSLGRRAVVEFANAGYDVHGIDRIPPRDGVGSHCIADVRDLAQVCGAMSGCDAVLHLAAIPSPACDPPAKVFTVNAMGTFNVLEAAETLGISRVVNVSSASALGAAYAIRPIALQYVPVDEEHPSLPQDAYGLSKLVGEEICAAFHRRTGGDAVSLRFPLIWDSQIETEVFDSIAADERKGRTTFWSYTAVEDAARACRLALEKTGLGASVFYVSAPENFMNQPSAELARRHLPGPLEIRADEAGRWSFFDCDRAASILGFTAEHFWLPR